MVLRPRSGLENPLTGKGVVAGVRKSLKRKPLIKPYLGLLFSSFSRGVGGGGGLSTFGEETSRENVRKRKSWNSPHLCIESQLVFSLTAPGFGSDFFFLLPFVISPFCHKDSRLTWRVDCST